MKKALLVVFLILCIIGLISCTSSCVSSIMHPDYSDYIDSLSPSEYNNLLNKAYEYNHG